MEALVQFTSDTPSIVPVPTDLLELIAIYTNDPVNQNKLTRTTLGDIIVLSQTTGIPRKFYRQGPDYLIGPAPPVGTVFWVSYYQSAATLVQDSDTNWLTEVAPDLLRYAALCYAADFFLDERTSTFETRYQGIIDALTNQAQQDDLVNASIAGAYQTDGFSNFPDNPTTN